MNVLIFDTDPIRARIYKKNLEEHARLTKLCHSVQDVFTSLLGESYDVFFYNLHGSADVVQKFLSKVRKRFPKISIVAIYHRHEKSLLQMFMSFGCIAVLERVSFVPSLLKTFL